MPTLRIVTTPGIKLLPEEPLTPPITGALSEDGMRSIIAGTADEIVPFALSLIVDGETPEEARKRLWWIATDEGPFNGGNAPLTAEAMRAALYRQVAAGVALLALDERVRGEEVVAREMAQLGEKGIH